ncbi:MAG: hypothetical protein JKX97_03420 [Candidatus Lindowbacteria bacterium]|nr:hypothetical protein [Candidatus Lindowbacteria bacterium]
MNELIIARDVMRKTWDSITPSVSLSDAITQLHQSKEQSIVVVDPEDDLKILGFLEELDAVTAERRSGRRNH